MNDTPNPPHTGFASMLATLVSDGEDFTISLPADWLQGRTAYGGLSAALCLQSALRAFPELPPLRSAQVAFIGPASGDLKISPRLLRQGKSAAFVAVDLFGEAGLAVRATFCFGAGRELVQRYKRHTMPVTPPKEAGPDFFHWPDRPNFMAHFDGRLAGGSLPLSSGTSPEMLVWLRHRDHEVRGDLVSLVALADALPPVAYAIFDSGVPLSTMTWAFDMLEAKIDNPQGWWLLRGETEHLHEGYSAQSAVIWHPDGHAVMASRQQVAIFARR